MSAATWPDITGTEGEDAVGGQDASKQVGAILVPPSNPVSHLTLPPSETATRGAVENSTLVKCFELTLLETRITGGTLFSRASAASSASASRTGELREKWSVAADLHVQLQRTKGPKVLFSRKNIAYTISQDVTYRETSWRDARHSEVRFPALFSSARRSKGRRHRNQATGCRKRANTMDTCLC